MRVVVIAVVVVVVVWTVVWKVVQDSAMAVVMVVVTIYLWVVYPVYHATKVCQGLLIFQDRSLWVWVNHCSVDRMVRVVVYQEPCSLVLLGLVYPHRVVTVAMARVRVLVMGCRTPTFPFSSASACLPATLTARVSPCSTPWRADIS